jgi:hypothetical protein
MSDNDRVIPPADDETPANPPPDENDEPEQPDSLQASDTPDDGDTPAEDLGPRLERLGGEPAPDISPEEFARLQQSGQIHIDPRGRVRTTSRAETDAGISLRKRRAWYGN